jgi:hypothetical protein
MKLLNVLTLLAETLRQKCPPPSHTKKKKKFLLSLIGFFKSSCHGSWVMEKSTKCTWRLERQIFEGALSIRQLSALLQKVLVILKD